MSSIITQGYGPNQRIILEGYGPSLFWLTVHLYQTLLFSPSFSRRWDALRTFPESVHHTDSIIKRTDFRLLESIILSPAVSALKFVERVVEVISRKIPWMRVPFKVKIPIKGTTVRPFRREIPMYGDLFYPRQLGVDLKGTTTFPFHRTISLYGDKSFPFVFIPSIQGYPVHPALIRTKLHGDWSSKFKQKQKVKGEKDFSEVIWEILEDDENGD